MAKLRVHNLAVSLDGYAAGPDQSTDEPMGVGGEQLHEWMFTTAFWHSMVSEPGGETGVDDDVARRGDENIGATIMGRNMFGPVRGEWRDSDWKGWWGPEPPYHQPVFVLTHHAHDPIEMAGGTTFFFVTAGIEPALERAVVAAGGQDVRLAGGPGTIREYLRSGLVDELHVAVVPLLLGAGERLLDDGVGNELTCAEFVASPSVAHVRLVRA